MQNQTAHDEITEQFKLFKASNTPREHRMIFAEDLVERYFAANEKMPAQSVLDRLATLILQDEIVDATPWKVRNTEYPISSPRQELDYHKKLVASGVPKTMDMDSTDRRYPHRRKKSPYEYEYIEQKAREKHGTSNH